MNETNLFLGEYDHVLDAQNRITFPKDWRSSGESEMDMVMIPTGDRSLVLVPVSTFMEFVEDARKLAIADAKMQMAFAILGAQARRCRCDKQGRMTLDRQMLKNIGIEKNLKLVGALNHIRLSAPENWRTNNSLSTLDSCLAEIRRISAQSGNAQHAEKLRKEEK